MPMDNELRLVSRLVRDRDLTPALERGITSDWFANSEARRYWAHISKHWMQYAEVPSVNALKLAYPGSLWPKIADSSEYLVDQFVAFRRRKQTIGLIQDLGDIMRGTDDYEAALARMSLGITEIGGTGTGERETTDLHTGMDERIRRYLDLSGSFADGLRGLPTGFATIDKATGGLQPEQLITLIATPKVGKSTLALVIADYISRMAHHPMFVTFEMSIPEQESRALAVRAGISHTRLVNGQLKPEEKRRLRQLSDSTTPFTFAHGASVQTVSGIAGLLARHKPEILVIDGVYLMLDELTGEANTPQALTNITRSVKRLAQRFQIPILQTTQALPWKGTKAKGINADMIGYSSSFFQDSDVVLGLQRPMDERDDERLLRVLPSRNCGMDECALTWDWEHGSFTESATTTTGSVEDAVYGDDG